MLQKAAGDDEELLGIVILELIFVREASHQSRIGVEHRVHLLQVASEDDQHVGVGLREHGEQRVDDPRAEVLAVAGSIVERVGLVDEKHIASRLVEDGLHILLGLADVSAHESGTVDGDDIPSREQSQGAVNTAELLGDGGLAGSRIAGEDAVERGFLRGGQSAMSPLSEELRVCCHPSDAFLHLVESNHLVQVFETLFVGGFDADEPVEAEVINLNLRQALVVDLLITASQIARLHLFDDELPDVGRSPGREDALVTAL